MGVIMTVMCIRIEFDTSLKKFVFAFVTVKQSEEYSMPGEIRVMSENRDAFVIGQDYECYLK